MQDYEAEAREAVGKAISNTYEPTDKPLAEGTQQLDCQWLLPLWGCDTLDQLRDDLVGRIAALATKARAEGDVEAALAELREIASEMTVSIEAHDYRAITGCEWCGFVKIVIGGELRGVGATLTEAMQKVREWKLTKEANNDTD